jgi:hypothetical protein
MGIEKTFDYCLFWNEQDEAEAIGKTRDFELVQKQEAVKQEQINEDLRAFDFQEQDGRSLKFERFFYRKIRRAD